MGHLSVSDILFHNTIIIARIYSVLLCCRSYRSCISIVPSWITGHLLFFFPRPDESFVRSTIILYTCMRVCIYMCDVTFLAVYCTARGHGASGVTPFLAFVFYRQLGAALPLSLLDFLRPSFAMIFTREERICM